MGLAGNFHPEWGYLAPAPSFMRTARVVLVATAVGATAGAGVVLSLVDRPAAAIGENSVAARTLVRPVEAAPTPVSAPQAAQAKTPTPIPNQSAKPSSTDVRDAVVAESGSSLSSTARAPTGQAPTSIAALAEAPVATAVPATAQPTPAVDAAPVQKKAVKKHHFASDASRGGLLGLVPGSDFMSGSFRDGRRDRRDRWDRDRHRDRWDSDNGW